MNFVFWRRGNIPDDEPEALRPIIGKVKASSSKEEALETAHRLMASLYKGRRGQTYWQLWRLFRDDLSILSSPPGFLHCTHMNYILETVLVKSGWFKASDVLVRWTVVFGFSPHQYMEVLVGGKWIDVDLWGASYGLPLGDHSSWFHVGRLW